MIYGNTFQPDERFNGDNIVSLRVPMSMFEMTAKIATAMAGEQV